MKYVYVKAWRLFIAVVEVVLIGGLIGIVIGVSIQNYNFLIVAFTVAVVSLVILLIDGNNFIFPKREND